MPVSIRNNDFFISLDFSLAVNIHVFTQLPIPASAELHIYNTSSHYSLFFHYQFQQHRKMIAISSVIPHSFIGAERRIPSIHIIFFQQKRET